MKKDFIFIAVIIAVVAIVLAGTKFQTVDEYYSEHADDIEHADKTVFVSINCKTARDNFDNLERSLQSDEFVPPDGVILAEQEFVLNDGDSVYDVLNRVARYKRIQLEAENDSYVKGINNLYEFSCGPTSGWLYQVNDQFPGVSCMSYELEDKDHLDWVYTCNLGKDVGSPASSLGRQQG